VPSPTTLASVLLAVAAGSASVLFAADANAAWRHFPSNMCTGLDGAYPPQINSQASAYNPSGARPATWACPVVTDSEFPASNAAYVQLWGWVAGWDQVKARECRTYYGGYGGTCSSPVTAQWNGSDGVFSLQWTPGSWADGYSSAWTQANPADSLYLSVWVAGSDVQGEANVLYGYGFSW
jgi:hypothetical protein